MNRKEFITQYYLSAITGSISMRSAPKPYEIIEDAEAAWAALDQLDADVVLDDVKAVRQKRVKAEPV